MNAGAGGLDVFYPILPSARWVARIVPLGVRCAQLRAKGLGPEETKREIRESLAIAAQHRCQLIVNDYWREAIELGAGFVHLGQEDLAGADLDAIRAAGLRIGVSSHDERELETALQMRPDYVALGPIYETKLKAMPWAPQGLDRVTEWKRRIGALPLVAIGGLTLESAPAVIAAGADSVAVVTDVVAHFDPEARVRDWLATFPAKG